MQLVAYPCLVMASISIFVGLFYLSLYVRGHSAPVHLPFAVLCFNVALYNIFSIGLYDAQSVIEGVVYQRLQFDAVDLISICMIWFVVSHVGGRWRAPALVSIGWFVALLVVTQFLNPELTVSSLRPSIKHIELFGLPPVIYNEGELGIVFQIGIGSAVVVYLLLMIVLFRDHIRRPAGRSLVLFLSFVIYFVGAVNDALVASGGYQFIYVSEYSFMLVMLAMGYVLLGELVSLYRGIEEANAQLEVKVEKRTSEILKLNEELRRQAELDALTGIYNRRFFSQYLEIELRRARNSLEHKVPDMPGMNDMNFGLAMIDIDLFKRINDTYGHPAGDRALIEVVKIIQSAIFSRDIFCRYGGEEFVILFTGTSREGIMQAIEKIRRNVEESSFLLDDDGHRTRITVSVGVVIFEEVPTLTTQQLLRIADNRLLIAKRTGRNRIVSTSSG